MCEIPLNFQKLPLKRGSFYVLELKVFRFGPYEFFVPLITNFRVLPTKNLRFILKFEKLPFKRGIFDVFHVFANLRMKYQFLVGTTLNFMISDPKNHYGPNLDTHT